MTPYYEHNGITIILGDCREILPLLSNVTCIVTSPPYNQRISEFSESGMHRETSWVAKVSGGYLDARDETEYQSEQIAIANLLATSLADDGSLFYNHKLRWRDGVLIHPVAWFAPHVPLRFRQEIIWSRDGSPTLNARMFAPSEERILWFCKGGHKWNQSAMKMSVWDIAQFGSFGRQYDGINGHPCPYPEAIPERCILATSDEQDLVLDPFAGSGTTLVSAKRLNRKAIGIEIEERYCEIAAKRLAQEILPLEAERESEPVPLWMPSSAITRTR